MITDLFAHPQELTHRWTYDVVAVAAKAHKC
jgi:hypothetical protein